MPGFPTAAGRIAAVTAITALALLLSPAAASGLPTASAPGPAVASKPEGPIESTLSVGVTGIVAAAGTIFIVRRHERRQRRRR
ncbi:hypothetical protein [Streptomyces qinzhouensis]|uniref:Uncharacterized protein n=1 Tax=Streptomyces qinzhouensis TaxID=2599401 RepID=A0A5B8J760_9ACTN|nr:hypothetical protein [Streptomyces qinzhouensis]QDY77635.1 hypothetical protein FQU76_15100 [Streptomyces qinzhouensis]